MDTPSNSASPPSASGKGHTRAYQACGPCRKRKVRCDLGPPDDPHPPPCARCKREGKSCWFAPERRKRKNEDGDEEGSEYDMRDIKRARSVTADRNYFPPNIPGASFSNPIATRPTTPGGRPARDQPLRRPGSSHSVPVDPAAVDRTLEVFQTHETYSGRDGIGMLINAMADNDRPQSSRRNSNSRSASFASPQANFPTRSGIPNQMDIRFGGPASQDVKSFGLGRLNLPQVPAAVNGRAEDAQNLATLRVTKAWNRLRFVRAGLFTAAEGMQYVDHFYKELYPLTPIRIPYYNDPTSQVTLLEHEPMLLVTILTITCRYMTLDGPGGKTSRPYVIHEKLWTYLRGMIERIIWAQEQFGGGLCGAGAEAAKKLDPFSQNGLRTLGTVESFMLLTEWHPRALHFPPGDDDEELLIPENSEELAVGDNDETSPDSDRRSWLEPSWRSDRMCWMLLGHALSLAFEIGVFENIQPQEFLRNNPAQPVAKIEAYFVRKNNLQKLLWIYYVQTTGRLELISRMPEGFLENLYVSESDLRVREHVDKRVKFIANNPNKVFSPTATIMDYNEDHNVTLKFWEEIAAIMKSGNQNMFRNRAFTREIIQSGRYKDYLEVYRPLLENWKKEFDSCTTMAKMMRHVLTIEYEYTRVYLYCLAFQAVVWRCLNNSPAQRNAQAYPGGRSTNDSPKSSGGAIQPQVVVQWLQGDNLYVKELVEACHNVLKAVVDGLLPEKNLQYSPVRTYFRIIAVTSILLKTILLGDYAKNIAKSFDLIEAAALGLRGCIVDDVHIGNRFAEMAETLVARVKPVLFRIPIHQEVATAAASRAPSQSPQLVPAPFMAPTNGTRNMNNVPHQQRMNTQQSMGNQEYMQQSFSQNPYMVATTGQVAPTYPAFHHSGIPNEIYDVSSNEISFMPPPNFYPGQFENQYGNGGAGPSNYQSMDGNVDVPNNGNDFVVSNNGPPSTTDWVGLPLDPLIANYGADVDASLYGPDVGGMDMLDMYSGMS